jgi:hypothetical protein
MKNKPIPYSKTLLGTILLIMSASSFAATQSIPQYIPGAAYHGGDQVQNIGKVYECKPWPCGESLFLRKLVLAVVLSES